MLLKIGLIISFGFETLFKKNDSKMDACKGLSVTLWCFSAKPSGISIANK